MQQVEGGFDAETDEPALGPSAMAICYSVGASMRDVYRVSTGRFQANSV